MCEYLILNVRSVWQKMLIAALHNDAAETLPTRISCQSQQTHLGAEKIVLAGGLLITV